MWARFFVEPVTTQPRKAYNHPMQAQMPEPIIPPTPPPVIDPPPHDAPDGLPPLKGPPGNGSEPIQDPPPMRMH